MDKKFITLNELQHYVNFKGKNKNEKVKTFLNNVFEIGFSLKYSDIFSMEDFEYGDLLVLDYEFLYNEYLKFRRRKRKKETGRIKKKRRRRTKKKFR